MNPPASAVSSIGEVYRNGRYAPFLQTYRLAGSAPVELVRFAQPAGEFPDPPVRAYTLSRNESGSGRMRFDIGTGRHELAFRPGDLVLTPPGVATAFANDAAHRKAFISLPAGMVGQLARDGAAPGRGAAIPDFGRLHDGSFRSAVITNLLDLIWSEAALEGPHARLFSDGVCLALVAALLRLAAPARHPVRPGPHLSAARLARVQGWVEAHLAEPFGLAEMAGSACLSPWHFSRAFKNATGQTPRAFVGACRIDRARRLLADSDLPLSQVAQQCGFADQPHFSTAFRRHTGMTPRAFRCRHA
jgi:AraC family transcriptional regulator